MKYPLLAGLAVAALACGGKARPRPQAATVAVGECADPGADGMVSRSPRLERADRDLNGDGQNEAVVGDRRLCSPDGNCHWNLFYRSGRCWRYVGTIAAASLEQLDDRGMNGFRPLVGWWHFGSGRSLRQEYHFRQGAYRLSETLVCREQSDDRVLCAHDGGKGAGR